MKFLVCITHYNRPDMLRRLVTQLFQQGGMSVWPVVFDDCSLLPPPRLPGASVVQHIRRYGKDRFWMTVRECLQLAKKAEFDYFILLQDDLELCDRFFHRVMETWEAVGRTGNVVNLLTDQHRAGRSIWGQPPPEHHDMGGLHLVKCNWTEPIFFTDRAALEKLDYEVHPIDAVEGLGTRVGKQISSRWNDAGVRIWQAQETFVHHGTHESVMHPELRRITPLIA